MTPEEAEELLNWVYEFLECNNDPDAVDDDDEIAVDWDELLDWDLDDEEDEDEDEDEDW